MRSFRQIAITALVTIGAFSAVTYTACSKKSDPANAKFVGTYNGTETCTPPLSGTGWTSQITASSGGDNQIVIDNFGDAGGSVTATISSNGTSFTIPSTTVSGSTVSGSGSIASNTITLSYHITAPSPSYTGDCVQTLIKQ